MNSYHNYSIVCIISNILSSYIIVAGTTHDDYGMHHHRTRYKVITQVDSTFSQYSIVFHSRCPFKCKACTDDKIYYNSILIQNTKTVKLQWK